jgi:hypothetical protein
MCEFLRSLLEHFGFTPQSDPELRVFHGKDGNEKGKKLETFSELLDNWKPGTYVLYSERITIKEMEYQHMILQVVYYGKGKWGNFRLEAQSEEIPKEFGDDFKNKARERLQELVGELTEIFPA